VLNLAHHNDIFHTFPESERKRCKSMSVVGPSLNLTRVNGLRRWLHTVSDILDTGFRCLVRIESSTALFVIFLRYNPLCVLHVLMYMIPNCGVKEQLSTV
jgi:hypothetical protein